jgi:hypothetical protein
MDNYMVHLKNRKSISMTGSNPPRSDSMDQFAELVNFFGNPDLDRHRLLQGQWKAYRHNLDDPDGWSDNPLELLLISLADEFSTRPSDERPAVRALEALLGTALKCFSSPEFCNVTRSFWRGFEFVAQRAASEFGIVHKDIGRDDVCRIIENRYGLHAA